VSIVAVVGLSAVGKSTMIDSVVKATDRHELINHVNDRNAPHCGTSRPGLNLTGMIGFGERRPFSWPPGRTEFGE
jgi:ABC-type phosphate/phosphonate transport system ATPase subunit